MIAISSREGLHFLVFVKCIEYKHLYIKHNQVFILGMFVMLFVHNYFYFEYKTKEFLQFILFITFIGTYFMSH